MSGNRVRIVVAGLLVAGLFGLGAGWFAAPTHADHRSRQ